MSLRATDHAAAKALAQVLNVFDSEFIPLSTTSGDGPGWVCAYCSNFAQLWDSGVEAATREVAIVWTGGHVTQSFRSPSLEQHLNPLVWGMCASKSPGELKVLILDTAPLLHRRDSALYRLVEAIRPDRMPWLRLVPLGEFGRFIVEQFIKEPDRQEVDEIGSREELLKLLSQQMREELTKEGKENERHAIQNIVGPMVLLGREYLGKQGTVERALLRVFETTGLMPKELAEGNQPGNRIKEDSWGDQPLRLLLVDDQANCGWADWLRANLPKSKPNLVSLDDDDVYTSPESFLDTLTTELEASPLAVDRRFEFRLRDNSSPPRSGTVILPPERQPILLLDLRLHATRSATDEAAFFKRLLPLCERFKVGGQTKQLAWPGFSPQELQTVALWCQEGRRVRETDEHFLGLSLFPRLLALLDMSLPIILFSSTGRRSLIQYFEEYGNIITVFEKPRFFGSNADNVVATTRRRFRQAIREAVRIAAARRFLQKVLGVARRADHPRNEAFRGAPTLADIYIDESARADEPHFGVGGLLLLYTRDKKDALQAALKSRGLEWGVCVGASGIEWPSKGSVLPKEYRRDVFPDYREKYEAHLEDLAKCFRDTSVTVISLGMRMCRQELGSSVAGIPMTAGDVVYRRLVGDVLELALASIFSLAPPNQHITLNVHVATRVRPMEVAAHEAKAKADELFRKFGIHQLRTDRSNEIVIQSVRSDDVWPLVMDILGRHAGQISQVSFDLARGVRLLEYTKANSAYEAGTGPGTTWYNYTREAPLPERIHYLADWISRFATWEWDRIPPTARVWFQAGFQCSRTRDIQVLLQAIRCVALNSFSQALTEMHRGWSDASEREPANVNRWIACHAARIAYKLIGSDFQRFWTSI